MASNNTLRESTAKGFFWGALSNGTQQVVTMLIGIIMARTLSASDYGMVAMLSVFSILAGNLQESGFTSALCVKKDTCHEDYNAVFWFSILMSLTIYLLLFVSSPLIAEFNHTPELTTLGRVIFLGFFISSFGTAHAAYLFRHLMVKEKTSSQVVASLLSGITGLSAAFLDFGYWSLVVMDLTYKITYTSLVWHYSPWRPSMQIQLKPAFRMFGFSSRILLTNLLNTVNNQLLQSILGHFYVQSQVGQYSQANKWTTMGSSLLTGMVGNVAQPVLSSVNEEKDRQVRIFRKMLRFTALFAMPSLLGLSFVAPEFIYLTIGEKWMPCVPYLQILCVAGAILPINQMFSNLLISKGHSDSYLIGTGTFLACQLTAVLLLYPYGIQPLLYTITALNLLWLAIWQWLAQRLVKLSLWQTLKDILPFTVLTLTALFAAYWAALPLEHPLLKISVKIFTTGIVYATLLQLCHVQIWRECLDFLLEKIRRKPRL